jgi:3-dehydroquinate dehydratase II
MASILILNGPNLNLLGTREPAIYGTRSFDDYLVELRSAFPDHTVDLFQSNREGELIDALQAADGTRDGVVMNAAGYTHTSVAIRDTIAGLHIPVVEVHISNIHGREEFRERSITGSKCAGVITGFGLEGYRLAIDHLVRRRAR